MNAPRFVLGASARLAGACVWGLILSASAWLAMAQDRTPAPEFQARTLSWSTVFQPPPRQQPSPTQQQSDSQTTETSTEAADVADALGRGHTLESQHRWADALVLYQDAARRHFDQRHPELDQHLDIARMHFDISRRWADDGFRRTARALSDRDALEVYTEAATLVQSHYVQDPDWARLTSRGTADLEIALREHVFEDSHVRDTRSSEIESFLSELRRQLSQHQVYSLSDARTAVWNAAQMGKLYLHSHAAAIMLEYTAAMVGGLDEYSSFLPAGALNDLRAQLEGDYIGLGLELKSADGSLLIVDVIHDSPAERSGIKSGDKILSVNGRSTSEVDVQRAIELLTGPEGTTIQLSVATNGDTLRQFMLQREHLEVSSVANVKLVDPSFGISYFKVKSFQKTTGKDVDLALWQLSGQGMRSLIIDLRGNPGGLLTAAVEVTQKFVASGMIVSTRGRGVGEGQDYRAHGAGQWRMPLIVLIDGNTASAAEIMSGALRDYRRATIVGVRSYGKGSVQTVFPLAIGGVGVQLTTAQFYSPLGTAFSHVGVQPDVWEKEPAQPVEGTAADTVIRDDEVLGAAMQVARSQLLH